MPAPDAQPMPTLSKVDVCTLMVPIERPVQTSFGIMHARPAMFVRVMDSDGTFGWGEVWCNFPACGVSHRARLVETVLGPLLLSRRFDSPEHASSWLEAATAVLAIQSGEKGPFAHCIAGLDTALWDLQARRAGDPLWRYLGAGHGEVSVYASGINPQAPELVAQARREAGYRAFKLKIGFTWEQDVANLQRVRQNLAPSDTLMADVNQGWTLDEASRHTPQLQELSLAWLEEPLRADRPWAEWATISRETEIPIALGENLYGDEAFSEAIRLGGATVLQPDLAKWGGISGMLRVFKLAQEADVRCCPHFLGAGLGLRASAHVLAAQGGSGLLEVDSNPNPLRSELAPEFERPQEGRSTLSNEPGLGWEDPTAPLKRWIVSSASVAS